ILLEKMNAVPELDEPAILKLPGKRFRKGRRDQSAGLGGEQEFWIGRLGERRMGLLERGIEVGGLARDWDLVREAPGRPPRLRRREGRAIDAHLLVGQLPPHAARQHPLDKHVLFENELLPFAGAAEPAK